MTGFVQNAKKNEVVYTSFEIPMLEALSSGWITTVSQYVSGTHAGATGNGYYKGGNTLTSSFVPLGKYILSYYTKSPTLTNVTISGAAGTSLTTLYRKISSVYANGWYLVEAMVNLTAGGGQGGQVSLGFGSTIFIDELRLYPYDALMQTYIYDYQTNQLISTCDPSCKTMRYEYNTRDQLIGVLNHDNHYVQNHAYFYPSTLVNFVHSTVISKDVLTEGITTQNAVDL
jgi:YD repeat-containing protein